MSPPSDGCLPKHGRRLARPCFREYPMWGEVRRGGAKAWHTYYYIRSVCQNIKWHTLLKIVPKFVNSMN